MSYELVNNTSRRAPKLSSPAIAKAYRKLPWDDEQVSEKSATERLRRMLDERGVKYETKDSPEASHADWEAWMHGNGHQPSEGIRRETLWGQPTDQNGDALKGVYLAKATEMGDRLFLEAQLVTPEQAIAATLGRGTCSIRGGECDQCGAHIHRDAVLFWVPAGGGMRTVESRDVSYCPNCGRKVVE